MDILLTFLTFFGDRLVEPALRWLDGNMTVFLAGFIGWLIISIRKAIATYLTGKARFFAEQALTLFIHRLRDAIDRGLAIAQQETPEAKAAEAAGYVLRNMPDSLKSNGVDATQLVERVKAQIAQATKS